MLRFVLLRNLPFAPLADVLLKIEGKQNKSIIEVEDQSRFVNTFFYVYSQERPCHFFLLLFRCFGPPPFCRMIGLLLPVPCWDLLYERFERGVV